MLMFRNRKEEVIQKLHSAINTKAKEFYEKEMINLEKEALQRKILKEQKKAQDKKRTANPISANSSKKKKMMDYILYLFVIIILILVGLIVYKLKPELFSF